MRVSSRAVAGAVASQRSIRHRRRHQRARRPVGAACIAALAAHASSCRCLTLKRCSVPGPAVPARQPARATLHHRTASPGHRCIVRNCLETRFKASLRSQYGGMARGGSRRAVALRGVAGCAALALALSCLAVAQAAGQCGTLRCADPAPDCVAPDCTAVAAAPLQACSGRSIPVPGPRPPSLPCARPPAGCCPSGTA